MKGLPKAIAIIPARMGSTRFPGKPLASDTGKPMVVHVCEQAKKAELVSNVVVATHSHDVRKAEEDHGFDAVITSAEHENGTSRLAEAAQNLRLKDRHYIINVQGDEPEIEPETIDSALIALFSLATKELSERSGFGHERRLGTVATPFTDDEDVADPNLVKVVTGLMQFIADLTQPSLSIGRALYFSRASIPFDRDYANETARFRHVGIYAYTAYSLREYAKLPPTPLEECEKLEQLRWLEHGLPIAVAVRRCSHQGIDTPEQYAAFVERFKDDRART